MIFCAETAFADDLSECIHTAL